MNIICKGLEVGYLLECCAVKSVRSWWILQRRLSPPSSGWGNVSEELIASITAMKHQPVSARLHSERTQKTTILIFAVMRTWYLTAKRLVSCTDNSCNETRRESVFFGWVVHTIFTQRGNYLFLDRLSPTQFVNVNGENKIKITAVFIYFTVFHRYYLCF